MRFVYTKPRFITFPSTTKKKKKKIPRHLHSFTSIKILANESTNSTPFQLKSPPARGEKKGEISDQSWRSILFEKKKREREEYSKWRKRRMCEVLFCRLFSSFTGLGSEGRKRGTGFPKKGKRLGMQVACVSRDCTRTHANAINYTRRRERRGNHKRTCYVPDINPASGHKIDYSAPRSLLSE